MLGGAHGLGDGKLHGNERAVAVKLPIPQSFLAGPLNFTVREDEFNTRRCIGIVMLIGSSTLSGERYTNRSNSRCRYNRSRIEAGSNAL
jgi:hypothetical protein